MSAYVVVSYPTVMDGTVIRWYRSDQAAIAGESIISASRNGVMSHGALITPDVFEAAWVVHERLKLDRRADLRDVVTHTKSLFGGELREVSR